MPLLFKYKVPDQLWGKKRADWRFSHKILFTATVTLILILGRPTFAQEKQATEASPSPPALYPTASPPIAPGPFVIRTADGNSWLRVGGLIQSELHAFPSDSGRTGNNAFTLRRARPLLAGALANFVEFRLMPEFGEGRAILQDGYIDLRLGPQFVVRSGKFKPPYSLERLQMAADVPFVERSLANNLVPIRDLGLMLMGGPGKGGLEWELGVFNGTVDNSSGDTNTDNSLDIAARLFYQPFASHPKPGIQGFGFGVAGTSGRVDESLITVVLRTAGRSPFFRYTEGTTADGNRTRLAPQFFLYAGSLGVLGEYFTTQQRVRKDTVMETVTLNGLNLQATYVLTGEKTAFRNVIPRRPFDPTKGGGGAYEVALRYSHFHASNGAFQNGFSDPAVSAEDADAYTIGLNWYLTRQVKAQLNYEHTQFGHALRFPTGLHTYEDALLTNLQLQF